MGWMVRELNGHAWRSLALLSAVWVLVGAGPASSEADIVRDGRWFADQGNGTYCNPVLIGDYSDPDVVRMGDDYYLTASSFTDMRAFPSCIRAIW